MGRRTHAAMPLAEDNSNMDEVALIDCEKRSSRRIPESTGFAGGGSTSSSRSLGHALAAR